MGGEGANRKVATEFFRYFLDPVTAGDVCSHLSVPVFLRRILRFNSPSERRLDRTHS
jgi:hypothetical protein